MRAEIAHAALCVHCPRRGRLRTQRERPCCANELLQVSPVTLKVKQMSDDDDDGYANVFFTSLQVSQMQQHRAIEAER